MNKLIFKIIFVILFSTNLASEEVLKIGIDKGENHPYIYHSNNPINYNHCAYGNNNPGFEHCLQYLPYYGAEPDLIQYLCGGFYKRVKFNQSNRIGYQYEIIQINFDYLIPSLKSGEIDVIIAAMGIKPERKIEIDFSIPYFAFPDGSATAVGIRKNENDLKSKIDGAISEAISEGLIKKSL